MAAIEKGLGSFEMDLVPEVKPAGTEAPDPATHKFAQAPLVVTVDKAATLCSCHISLGCSPKTLWRSSPVLS